MESQSTWTLDTKKAQKFISAGALFALGVVIFYFAKFHSLEIGDPADWGLFGDYIGGVAGSVFAFLSFIVLVMTLLTQQQELRLTRDQLALEVDARKSQIETVQKNAKLERWARMAEEISRELDWYRQNPDAKAQGKGAEERAKRYPLMADVDGRQRHINIYAAFNVTDAKHFPRICHLSDLSEKLKAEFASSSLGRFVQLARNLNRVCHEAELLESNSKFEFSGFYSKHNRQFEGLVRKGYLKAANLNCFVPADLLEDERS